MFKLSPPVVSPEILVAKGGTMWARNGQCILPEMPDFHIAFRAHKMHRPVRHTVIFSLEILEKNNDECILILVIYWKKTGLLHTEISNHNIIYSS
jgi:hypothetical protein